MSKVKKQHYIPQFYLKRFVDNQEQIHVFDKPKLTTYPSNVVNVGNETYFYNRDQEAIDAMVQVIEEQTDELIQDIKQSVLATGDKRIIKEIFRQVEDPQFKERMLEDAKNEQFIESKVLAPHDDRSATLLKRVLAEVERLGRIKTKYRSSVAFMVAIQFLRTRNYRNQIMEIRDKALNTMIAKGFFGESYEDVEVHYLKEFEAREHISSLTDYDYYRILTKILNDHIWIVGVNNTPYPLYTSDTPIVMRGHLTDIHRGVGFASPGVEIAFPLSPKYVLTFCERTVFKDLEKLDGKTLSLNKDNVTYYNSLQVNQSRRQIYSSDNNFDLAIKMCNDNPKLRDPDRPRIMAQ